MTNPAKTHADATYPAAGLPVEIYTPERKAEFLLNNAVDAADYAEAVAEARAMGLDPAQIPHEPLRGSS